MIEVLASYRERLARLPWIAIVLTGLALFLLVAVVPAFRRSAAVAGSRVILFAARPFAPSTSGFDDLPQASRVLAADGSEVGLVGAELRDPMPLAQLPPHVVHAVLASEDANFYRHSGVDPSAVFRALFNTAAGRPQGGSTITQQLAKLNYTGSQRTLFRKFKEVLYASRLEQRYSKDELLERYLNQVYFGQGSYGIAAASSTFFGVTPQELSVAQAATLAGKIRSPSALDPLQRPEEVRERRDQVLRAMARHDWLGEQELVAATAEPVEVSPAASGADPEVATPRKASHFLAYVAREASRLDDLGPSGEASQHQVFTRGYTIETTMDPKAYDAAVEATRQFLGEEGDPTTAIVSVVPGDGAIRVLFGGLDPDLEFDPASQGRRQPGSSFKPYVYLAMLQARVDPRAPYDAGSPRTVSCGGGQWTVNNYEGAGRGSADADAAMTHSINTVYAQITARVGPSAVAETARKAGIREEAVNPAECAIGLGGLREGVSPLEQAAGFATFGAKGTYAEPYAITRILDRHGEVVYERGRPKAAPAFGQREVGVLTAALEGVVQGGTGTAAAIGRPMAGKTGTTENYGNAWFVGYVPQLATAVWVGHPEGDVPMTAVRGISVTGGSFPARIFGRYMREALAEVPVQDLYRASPDELGVRAPSKPRAESPEAAVAVAPTTTPSPPTTRPVVTLPPTTPTTRRPPRTSPPSTAAPVTTTSTPSGSASTTTPTTPIRAVSPPTTSGGEAR